MENIQCAEPSAFMTEAGDRLQVDQSNPGKGAGAVLQQNPTADVSILLPSEDGKELQVALARGQERRARVRSPCP